MYESVYIQYGDASVLGVTLKQNYNYHLRVQPMPTTKCVWLFFFLFPFPFLSSVQIQVKSSLLFSEIDNYKPDYCDSTTGTVE